jgi:hypothetical protein
MLCVAKVAAATAVVCGLMASTAWGTVTVTPGWECVPTTQGQPVVSGGTGPAPSCGASTTGVLAPTFVSSGVGGKPTVVFSTVNVQVISGSGSTTGTPNGEGNLILGYAENSQGYARTGSNDLIVGTNNGWTGYGEIAGGYKNQASGPYATSLGALNTASGAYSLAAGESNSATNTASSVTGGTFNKASAPVSSVAGGCLNVAGTGSPLSGTCPTSGIQAVLGGFENTANGLESTVSGGESNTAQANRSSVLGGHGNTASTNCQSIPASPGSC